MFDDTLNYLVSMETLSHDFEFVPVKVILMYIEIVGVCLLYSFQYSVKVF